jgi:uncharacterized protein YndB with AHSA1/START domain
MGSLDLSVWIKATPAEVWRVYVDPSRVPDWQTGKPVVTRVEGAPGQVGSTYVSGRGRLSATTVVLSAESPSELVTRTDASFGLRLDVTSRLDEESGGTQLRIHARARWRRSLGPIARLAEFAILNPREGRKELANLKSLVEQVHP